MSPIILFEDAAIDRLYPLAYNRSPFELPCGAGTLLSRMQRHLPGPIAGALVRGTLSDTLRGRVDMPINPGLSTRDGLLLINARWLMTKPFAEPPIDSAGIVGTSLAWLHLSHEKAETISFADVMNPLTFERLLPRLSRLDAHERLIAWPWDLLDQKEAITQDFHAIGPRPPASAPGLFALEPNNMHIAANVTFGPCVVLDARGGPIIIGENTEIKPHATIAGPVVIGHDCVIRTGADIREDTILGSGSRVGGEIIGSIFLGNANKQHHGFLGQSIVGQWANLGAGTTTSNLKNTYGNVRISINGIERRTERQFVGSIIGDHAKLGIGTYLNTGSVVGFGSHVVAPRPPKFVPSFAWATPEGIARADFEKIAQIARVVTGRRHVEFTPADYALFVAIADASARVEQFDWNEPTE